SRSERQLYLYAVGSLSSGPLATVSTDVSPSTLIPFYDEDTSTVFLTGKGDTRVYVYEITPESPHFLECSSFNSSDPHKVPTMHSCQPLVHTEHFGAGSGDLVLDKKTAWFCTMKLA
ncbi:CORO7 protein, partial [Polyodon spathula]|nr:CORO7 protein [Polyodon spathula]